MDSLAINTARRSILIKKKKYSQSNVIDLTEGVNVINNNTQNIFDNNKIIDCIQKIGEYSRFLSIICYICLIFFFLTVIYLFIYGNIVDAFIYLLFLGGFYFMNNNLWKASKLYRNIATNKTIDNLESGIKRMTEYWKTMVIITKVYLLIIFIIVCLAIISVI